MSRAPVEPFAPDDAALALLVERVEAGLAEKDPATDLRRLLHGRGGCFPGLEALFVDRLGPVLRVGLHAPADRATLAELGERLAQPCATHGVSGAWLSDRRDVGAAARPSVLLGAPPGEVMAREDGIAFQLHPGRHRNAGLFLDARGARRWVHDAAAGARVLNLFAYTCGFSLAALAGGAAQVDNVDMARGALAVGQRNHDLNGLTGARFLPHDVFRSWGALRRRGPFDLIVLDPPTRQPGSFVGERDWPRLLRRLPSLAAPGARVLALLNDPFGSHSTLAAHFREALPQAREIERLPCSADFPDRAPEAGLKASVWALE